MADKDLGALPLTFLRPWLRLDWFPHPEVSSIQGLFYPPSQGQAQHRCDHHTLHTTSWFVLRSKGPGAACCRLPLSASSQHRIPRADSPSLSVGAAYSISAAVLCRQRLTSGQERTGSGVRKPSPSPKPASEGPAWVSEHGTQRAPPRSALSPHGLCHLCSCREMCYKVRTSRAS